jgi:hypothetical protein
MLLASLCLIVPSAMLVGDIPKVGLLGGLATEEWSRTIAFSGESAPTLLAGRQCTVVASPELTIGLDPVSGAERWRRTDRLPLADGRPIRLFDFGSILVLAQASESIRYPGEAVGIAARTGKTLWERELDAGALDLRMGEGAIDMVAFSGSRYRVLIANGALAIPPLDELEPLPAGLREAIGTTASLGFRWRGGYVTYYSGDADRTLGMSFLLQTGKKWADAWGGRLRHPRNMTGRPEIERVVAVSSDRLWVLVYRAPGETPVLGGITPDGEFQPVTPPADAQFVYFSPVDTSAGIMVATDGWIRVYRHGEGFPVRLCGTDDLARTVSPAGLLKLARSGPHTFTVSLEPLGKLP